LSRFTQKAGGAEARVVNLLAELGANNFDHRPDDMPLCVELAGVPSGVRGHVLEQPFVQLREDDDIGLIGAVQPIDLATEAIKTRPSPGIVADTRKDASESLGNGILAQVLQLVPELAIDEGKHLIVVLYLGPFRPAEFAIEPPGVCLVAELGLR